VEAATISKRTVLVIDDDAQVRHTLVHLLAHEGFDALVATNGSEAIHIFGENASRICAATLDLEMPTTDGRETLAMLSEFAPKLPIVIASGLPLPDNLLGRAPGSLGVGYIQKPFTARELSAELRRVIAEEEGSP
jgi:CheY-like chemotaxis protein